MVSEEIQRLYDTVGHESAFVQALSDLRRVVQAKTLVMVSTVLPDPASSLGPSRHILALGVPVEAMVEYEHHFHAHDVWVQAGQARGLLVPGAVSCSDELLPRPVLENSYFWRAFLKRYGTTDALSAVIEMPPAADTLTFVTFHRGPEQPRFGAVDVARLRSWTPHLAITLRQHRRLATTMSVGQTWEALFCDASQPMLVLDEQGQVHEFNPAFANWLGTQAASIRLDHGQLQYLDAGVWTSLLSGWSTWLSGADSTFRVPLHRSAQGVAQHLVMRRVPASWAEMRTTQRRAALALVEEQKYLDPSELQLRFGLTPAQTRVALLLAQGQAPADLARSLAVSTHTVRAHIRTLFLKTETTRLSALVARLWQL